jgi:glycosyltransferase involved in cell wall biosynthesis
MDTSLVIPAHNERENLSQLVAECRDVLDGEPGDHEIVVIDDGSTDGSDDLLAKLATEEPRLRVISHPPGRNIGCHPSELEGLRAARGEAAVFLPADLQIRPAVVPAFVAEIRRGADVVASHRVHRADAAWRRWLGAANNGVERALMGVGVHDAHSSMALARRALDEIVPHVAARSALIPAEILVRASRLGLRVSEIVVEHHPRAAGEQEGVRLREIARVQLDLIRLRRRLRAGEDPA